MMICIDNTQRVLLKSEIHVLWLPTLTFQQMPICMHQSFCFGYRPYYNDQHSESSHVWPYFQCLQTLLVDIWSVRWYIVVIYNISQHFISQYICTNVAPAERRYSMFPSGQAGLPNHWPVFGGVSWCPARLEYLACVSKSRTADQP